MPHESEGRHTMEEKARDFCWRIDKNPIDDGNNCPSSADYCENGCALKNYFNEDVLK